MRFHVLGSLEVVADGRPVPLGGVHQRAALGFLLLYANQVVATSQLLQALWPGDAPPTARKMLQNAVSSLRRMIFRDVGAEESVLLLTHAPGYLLRVPPECVDLVRFRHMAERGRAELAAGSWERASGLLREAVALWRGPALADLVETGVAWPELAAVENSRLAALEDYAEAELAIGRHNEVVGELEALVEAEAPRERLCGHLMLALYRCGRQADALRVYRRTRTRLVSDFGLEPGPELQALQRAILDHDEELMPPSVPERQRRRDNHDSLRDAGSLFLVPPEVERGMAAPSREVREAHVAVLLSADGRPAEPPRHRAVETAEIVRSAAAHPGHPSHPEDHARWPGGTPAEPGAALAPPAATGVPGGAVGAMAERKLVSVVLVLTQLGPHASDDPDDVDEVLQAVAAVLRDEAERFGGVMGGALGPVWSILFGADRTREDDAARAVRAAVAIRGRLGPREVSRAGSPAASEAAAVEAQVTVQVAVATGEALVRSQRSQPGEQDAVPVPVPVVTGAVLDRCMRLLVAVPPGEMRICDATRQASELAVAHGYAGEAYSAQWPGTGRVDVDAADALPLPRLLHSMIASRLDALPAAVKEVAQDAAVLGGPVWVGAVAAVGRRTRSEVIPFLEYLEGQEFLQRARRSSVPGEIEYGFRHALVRDVAYGQLPRSARADKHRQAVSWLADARGDHAVLLAYHRGQVAALAAGRRPPAGHHAGHHGGHRASELPRRGTHGGQQEVGQPWEAWQAPPHACGQGAGPHPDHCRLAFTAGQGSRDGGQ